jgi:hypothetical protein
MILNAIVHGHYHYATTWPEMATLITEVIEGSSPERSGPGVDPGEEAEFSWAEGRHDADTFDWWPDNYLKVAVNPTTGFGALLWYATVDRVGQPGDEIPKHIWVSDNPEPPDFDPRVVADAGHPTFHDRRSTLPTERIRVALEEFCRAGTGDRPSSVSWVVGEMNGERHDTTET